MEESRKDFIDQERAQRAKTVMVKKPQKQADAFDWDSEAKPLETPGYQADGGFDFDFEKSHSTPIDQPSAGGLD